MTLDDLERKNRGFYGFFGDFGLRHTFQEWQHSREMVAPSGVCKYIVPNVSCWIDELIFVLKWAFKHAPLSRVFLCVSWAFLIIFHCNDRGWSFPILPNSWSLHRSCMFHFFVLFCKFRWEFAGSISKPLIAFIGRCFSPYVSTIVHSVCSSYYVWGECC